MKTRNKAGEVLRIYSDKNSYLKKIETEFKSK